MRLEIILNDKPGHLSSCDVERSDEFRPILPADALLDDAQQ